MLARNEMLKADPEFAQWLLDWQKLREETKNKFVASKSQTWHNFQRDYLRAKQSLQL